MIPDRRSSKRGRYVAVSLLAVLSVVLSARPISAGAERGPAALASASLATGPIPTRIEGQIKRIDGYTWQVDETRVELSATTVIKKTKGNAEVGAWVVVVGDEYTDHLAAEIIQVLRPAGAPPPLYQFGGILQKKGSAAWQVNGTRVTLAADTVIFGNPVVGSLVRVSARWAANELVASEIAVIAPDSGSVSFALDGVVTRVSGTEWVVDEQPVEVPADQGVVAAQGDTVEVAAVAAADGSLVAQKARVVDASQEADLDGYVLSIASPDQDNQTWTVQVFAGGRVQTKTVQVSPETYVDEDRTVIETDVEALVQGQNLADATVDAALVRLDQPVNVTAAGALGASSPDALWSVGGQPVWFGTEQLRQEALGSAGAAGIEQSSASVPLPEVAVRGVKLRNGVIIAKEVLTGEAATQARLASVGAGSEAGTASTQAPGWQGPNGIGSGMTLAAEPTLLFDGRGGGHAVFEADGKIYYAYQPSGASWGTPVKIGTGVTPTAVFDSQGLLHVAFTDEFMGNYDIICVSMRPGGGWSLPRVVAPTSGKSADPVAAAGANGTVYVAWSDATSGEWAIQLGTWDGRYWTSYPVSNARGQNPAIDVLSDGALFLAWQDKLPVLNSTLGKYDIFGSERLAASWDLPRNISDNATFRPGSDSIGPQLASTRDGLVQLAWIDNGKQVRYDFGRGGYWPAPVNASDGQTMANGLSIQCAADGRLYLAWDDGVSIRVTSAVPGTQSWPATEVAASRTASAGGSVSDVSLTAAYGGIAISWVDESATGAARIYESRRNMTAPLLKSTFLPLVVR